MTGNDGTLDCQLVIEMIGRTWDRRFAQYPSQPDGPLKGAGGYIYIYMSWMPRAMQCRVVPCWCRTQYLSCRALVVSSHARDSSCCVVPWPIVPCLCHAVPCRAFVVSCLCRAVSCHAVVMPCFCRAVPCHASSSCLSCIPTYQPTDLPTYPPILDVSEVPFGGHVQIVVLSFAFLVDVASSMQK